MTVLFDLLLKRGACAGREYGDLIGILKYVSSSTRAFTLCWVGSAVGEVESSAKSWKPKQGGRTREISTAMSSGRVRYNSVPEAPMKLSESKSVLLI